MTLDIPVGFANAIFGYRNPVGGKGASWAMGFELSGALDNTIFNEALTALSGTDLGPQLLAGWDLISFTMEDNVSRFEQTFESPGTAGGNAASPQVCALFKKTTGLRGKRFQGRAYIPAGYLDDDDIGISGLIGEPKFTDLQELIDGVLGDIAAAVGPGQIVLFHTHADDAPSPIVGFSLEQTVATQRRRLR